VGNPYLAPHVDASMSNEMNSQWKDKLDSLKQMLEDDNESDS
jgi:hypothetical protein